MLPLPYAGGIAFSQLTNTGTLTYTLNQLMRRRDMEEMLHLLLLLLLLLLLSSLSKKESKISRTHCLYVQTSFTKVNFSSAALCMARSQIRHGCSYVHMCIIIIIILKLFTYMSQVDLPRQNFIAFVGAQYLYSTLTNG